MPSAVVEAGSLLTACTVVSSIASSPVPRASAGEGQPWSAWRQHHRLLSSCHDCCQLPRPALQSNSDFVVDVSIVRAGCWEAVDATDALTVASGCALFDALANVSSQPCIFVVVGAILFSVVDVPLEVGEAPSSALELLLAVVVVRHP